jgi:hypothetical protein
MRLRESVWPVWRKPAALVFAAFFASWLAVGGKAEAEVLTFDDIDPTANEIPIPNGYGGLTWTNMDLSNWQTSAPPLSD